MHGADKQNRRKKKKKMKNMKEVTKKSGRRESVTPTPNPIS